MIKLDFAPNEHTIQLTSPKEFRVKAAGSELLINDQGIFLTTPNTFQVKSNEKVMMGGERVGFKVPRLSRFGEYYLHFVMKGEYDNLLSGKNYILYNDKGEIVKTGVLDEEGKTSVLHDNLEKEYYIHVLDGEN